MEMHQPLHDTIIACRVCGEDDLVSLGRVDGYAFFQCAACEYSFTPLWDWRDAADDDEPAAVVARGRWARPDFLAPAFEILGDGPRRILDFGTGGSRLPEHLRRRGHRVIAVDKRPPAEPHPDRLTGDIFGLHLEDDEFDIAYAHHVFEHLPQPVPFVAELLRVTRPGGLVVICTQLQAPERDDSTSDEWWLSRPPENCSFYTHRTFEVLLEGTPHDIVYRDDRCVVIAKGRRQPAWYLDIETESNSTMM